MKPLYSLAAASLILPQIGCGTTASPAEAPFGAMPEGCLQVVLVQAAPGGMSKASARYYERGNGLWQVRGSLPVCYVGRHGFALPGHKVEGDGKTPSGCYPIGMAFGYADTLDTKLKYRHLKDDDFWIDDAKSPDYNRLVSGAKPAVSHEVMRRTDTAYKIGAVIEYNTNPAVAGKGSAIFLHVVNPGPDPHTAGCVAAGETGMAELLAWLDADKHPHIILNDPDHTAEYYDAALPEPKAK